METVRHHVGVERIVTFDHVPFLRGLAGDVMHGPNLVAVDPGDPWVGVAADRCGERTQREPLIGDDRAVEVCRLTVNRLGSREHETDNGCDEKALTTDTHHPISRYMDATGSRLHRSGGDTNLGTPRKEI